MCYISFNVSHSKFVVMRNIMNRCLTPDSNRGYVGSRNPSPNFCPPLNVVSSYPIPTSSIPFCPPPRATPVPLRWATASRRAPRTGPVCQGLRRAPNKPAPSSTWLLNSRQYPRPASSRRSATPLSQCCSVLARYVIV